MVHHSRMLVLVASCLLSACATIVSGSKQSVKIDSSPQGATIYTALKTRSHGQTTFVQRKKVGVTPMAVSVVRKDGAVLLEKDGYEPAEVPLKRGTNPWLFGDFLMGSLLSTSIDTSTGASNEYDPAQYMLDLTAKQEPVAPQPTPPAAPETTPTPAPTPQ